MVSLKGIRKLKTLDDKITANQSKIEEYENALVELKAERKILLVQKDNEDLSARVCESFSVNKVF